MQFGTIQGTVGFRPDNQYVWLINQTASALNPGAVCVLNTTLTTENSITPTGNTTALDTTSGLNLARTPIAADDTTSAIAIVYDPADGSTTLAAGKTGRFCVSGRVQALVGDTSTAGTEMTLQTDHELIALNAVDQKVFAQIQETGVDGSKKWVIFDGVSGLGTHGGS